MKNRISGIGGVCLVVVLVVSLLSFAAPASAGTLHWSAEFIPNTTGNVLGPAGVDVRDMAVAAGGTIIYAVPGDSMSDNVVYKSTDTGVNWMSLSVEIEADLVAAAPDNADVVAIASESTPAVYITIDGGSTWSSLGTPQESGGAAAEAIYDIAISVGSNGVNYIAAAGREAGDVANVWYFNLGALVPVWKGTNALAGFSNADVVKAVAFSPNFPSDKIMVAVSERDNVSVGFQILSFSSGEWNAGAGFVNYPVTIISDDGITDLASASISLNSEYQGSETATRIAFVGLTVDGDAAAKATSGIYRLKDTSQNGLKTGVNIHSMAYDGTNLVVGAYDSNIVYRSADPLTDTPTISTASSLKGPGGENKIMVGWAGSDVVAGASGDESAFAISRNRGQTFNDISLIDTVTTNVRDVAVSSDGSKVYLVTDDGEDLSLWRYVSSWERVLSKQGTADYIVRIAPEDANVVYLAKKGGKTVYYNQRGGVVKWLAQTCAVDVQDLAVESAEVVYALEAGGMVTKSIDGGFTWGGAKSTRLDSGATVVSASEDTLLVGSQDSYVAYSTDGNSSWTKISKVLQSEVGKVQVMADKNFATNDIIYAASDKGGQRIKRWKLGDSTRWTDIFGRTMAGGVYGLAMGEGGALYALEFNENSNQSTLWRCLSPTSATGASASWTAKTTTSTTDADDSTVQLNATPRALKVSSGGKLWAVKTNGTNKLCSFNDILTALTLRIPAQGFINPINPITGIANEIAFSWSRPSSATGYKLFIAYDKDFNELVTTVTVSSDLPTVVVLVGLNSEGDARVDFIAGTTYYWRVQVTQPLQSLYSATRGFTVKSLMALVSKLLTPENGGTGISRKPSFSWEPVSRAIEYRFVLADNVALASPIVDAKIKTAGFAMLEELDYGRTYYWAVKPVAPASGDWSALANFTVKDEPAAPASPIIVAPAPPIIVEQAPPPVITLPEPPPPQPKIVIPPPPLPLAPATPAYIWVIIAIGAVLVAAVIALIIRTLRVAEVRGEKLQQEYEEGQPISFAAHSFFWMLTSEEKENGARILSADEEQELGKIIVSRIKGLASEQLLYQKFPKDAALFLYLWSYYGSRDETNPYLIKSFLSNPGNVIEFLKCYLPASQESASPERDFNRTQYDSVDKVVDPENVVKALKKLYGHELDTLEGEESGDSPDKTIAYQFARIHYLVRSETESPV